MSHFRHQQEAPEGSYTPTMSVPPPEYATKDGPAGLAQQDQTTRWGSGLKRCCTTVFCCCFLDCCYIESQNICGLVLKFCCSHPLMC
ncbi:hypothetical protein VNO77_27902 [Canavalia gladiata]|uniref:Cysteine-rich transmembrane CYSTM domain-containing protein n=1 Tax=Canavalia gladiata TaxID=3824 RepID=A0AAN9KZR0_CANGL